MKKKLFIGELQKNKYKYIFLITIITLGILSGIILSNILSYTDKNEVGEVIKNYLNNLRENSNTDYIKNLIHSLTTNFSYLFLYIILSFSIIGVFLNPILLYFKSFIVGFSIGIFISIYSFKGIIPAIVYVLPHELINIIVYLLLSFYGMLLSIKLFKTIFFKKEINFSFFLKKYLKMILFASSILLLSSLYEAFLGENVMKIFTFLLN